MPFELEVQPRFDYARQRHDVEIQEHGVVFRSASLVLALEGSSFGNGSTPNASRQRRAFGLRLACRRVAQLKLLPQPARSSRR